MEEQFMTEDKCDFFNFSCWYWCKNGRYFMKMRDNDTLEVFKAKRISKESYMRIKKAYHIE